MKTKKVNEGEAARNIFVKVGETLSVITDNEGVRGATENLKVVEIRTDGFFHYFFVAYKNKGYRITLGSNNRWFLSTLLD